MQIVSIQLHGEIDYRNTSNQFTINFKMYACIFDTFGVSVVATSNFVHEWRFSVAIVMSVQLLTGGWRNNAHYLDGQTCNNNSQGRRKKED